jgi:hypothetical protein
MKENQQTFEGMKTFSQPDKALLSYKTEDLSSVLQSVGMIREGTLVKLSKEDEAAIIRLAEIKLQDNPQITEEDAITRAYLDRMVYLIGSGDAYLEGLDESDAAKLVSVMTGMDVTTEELELFKKFAKGNGGEPFTDMMGKWIEERKKAIEGLEPLIADVDGQDNVIEVRH